MLASRCNNLAVERMDQCTGVFFDPDKEAYIDAKWTNAHFNFDHLGNALLALFVTVTQDGYNDIMLNAMAVTDKGMQPKQQGNPGGFFFFMFFIMICAFCLLNLYVGVVFYQFSRIRLLSQTGSAFLTDHQQVRINESVNLSTIHSCKYLNKSMAIAYGRQVEICIIKCCRYLCCSLLTSM